MAPKPPARTVFYEYDSLFANFRSGSNPGANSRVGSTRNRHVLLSNGADRSRSQELHVCAAPGHNKSQRQYGSAVYLSISQAGIGECRRGDESASG